MGTDNSSFIVDGKYEDIIFEVEKELRQTDCFINELKLDAQQIHTCAEFITEFLLCSSANDGLEDKFERGILLAKTRHYLKIDLSLLTALSCIAGQILMAINGISSPDAGAVSIGSIVLLGVGESAVLNDVFRRIPEDAFCVLLAAHQHKSKHCVSVDSILDKLCSHDCPYHSVYRTAYGSFCNRHTPRGRCTVTREDVVRHLRMLGKDFGITEIDENKLFKAE